MGLIITNAFIFIKCHCEPEALHRMVFRAKGVAISSFLRLLRCFTPRNDKLFDALVLVF